MALKKEKWTVWALDVWGNEEDGFDVNDRSRVGSIVLSDQLNDTHVLKALKDGRFLKQNISQRDVLFDDLGHDDVIYVEDAKTGEPIFQLEKD